MSFLLSEDIQLQVYVKIQTAAKLVERQMAKKNISAKLNLRMNEKTIQ